MNRACRTGKIRYRDQLAARIALANTWGGRSSRREECRVYRCPACAGFHLTSKPRRKGGGLNE